MDVTTKDYMKSSINMLIVSLVATGEARTREEAINMIAGVLLDQVETQTATEAAAQALPDALAIHQAERAEAEARGYLDGWKPRNVYEALQNVARKANVLVYRNKSTGELTTWSESMRQLEKALEELETAEEKAHDALRKAEDKEPGKLQR